MGDPDYEYDNREDYDSYMDDLDGWDDEHIPFDPEAPHDHPDYDWDWK